MDKTIQTPQSTEPATGVTPQPPTAAAPLVGEPNGTSADPSSATSGTPSGEPTAPAAEKAFTQEDIDAAVSKAVAEAHIFTGNSAKNITCLKFQQVIFSTKKNPHSKRDL
ncbi:MAG: hypothetical protein LIO53_09160 [Oscillospiraceae bacterium]|nr:hypothetical protein [Oscillospiraceae bacterium]